jgi:SAM-dependent methyltransferase
MIISRNAQARTRNAAVAIPPATAAMFFGRGEAGLMAVLPPGTLLQLMYLRERLQRRAPGRFIEIGPGSGEITRLLLELGWQGTSFELDADTVAVLRARFAEEIGARRLTIVNDDFMADAARTSADLVISCMVMEHLDDALQAAFLARAAASLVPDGIMIGLVPGSPRHWGIEDDIAGHIRRYSRHSVQELVALHEWRLMHLAGLTFPVSNLLLPLSNYLVQRGEAGKLALSALERTKLSGRRNVRFKTEFPSPLALLLNEVTMYPLHLLQKACASAENALVLYFEAQAPLAPGNS